eukprot:363218-Chlamydomonas_euryale.AAC.8
MARARQACLWGADPACWGGHDVQKKKPEHDTARPTFREAVMPLHCHRPRGQLGQTLTPRVARALRPVDRQEDCLPLVRTYPAGLQAASHLV